MRLIEGKFNGKKIVSGRCNGVYVFNTKYQTFVNFTASRYKYAKNPFSFNNGSSMVIYLELTEEFDYNADNNFITIGNGERKSTFQITNAETQITDRGTIIYREYPDITTEDYSDGDYFQSGADLIDGAVIPISITFTNSKGEVETYNNYNGKYAQPVYDNTPPTVSLNGDYEIHVNLNGSYNEPGLTIDDNYLPEYATIKENIVYDSLTGRTKTATDIDTSVEGKYSITYNVSDTANNETNVVRYVYIDNPIRIVTGIVYDNSVTGQVTVTVNANKVIKLPTGWTYVDENEKSIYKVYKESVDEKLIVYDLTGQSDAMVVNVVINQSTPANVIKVEYSIVGKDEATTYYTNKAKSAGNIFISILLDKKLSNIPTFTINDTENHTLALDGTFVGKQDNGYYYTAIQAISSLSSFVDGEITFKISDIVDADGNAIGNISEATNGSRIILDTVAPKVTFTYSNNNGLALTSGDVTATVTANEQIQDITGWNRKTNNSLTKVFTKNTKDSLTVFDMAGNSTKASYEVKRIDKTPPDITIKTGSSETVGDATNGYSKISFKVHDASGMVSWQINDGVVTKLNNASWSDINYLVVGQKGVIVGNNVLKVTDKVGNVGTKTFKMIKS